MSLSVTPLQVVVTDNLRAIDGWAYAIAIDPQDQTAAIGGAHGQVRRIEIPSSAEK
ncbi:MAG: hypothetical protein HN610_00275 [Verrucomicrobia bacterium]|jgi:hypothetical protein|nr:hypothetical protein [Verrucomicrobiota bacterium]